MFIAQFTPEYSAAMAILSAAVLLFFNAQLTFLPTSDRSRLARRGSERRAPGFTDRVDHSLCLNHYSAFCDHGLGVKNYFAHCEGRVGFSGRPCC